MELKLSSLVTRMDEVECRIESFEVAEKERRDSPAASKREVDALGNNLRFRKIDPDAIMSVLWAFPRVKKEGILGELIQITGYLCYRMCDSTYPNL